MRIYISSYHKSDWNHTQSVLGNESILSQIKSHKIYNGQHSLKTLHPFPNTKSDLIIIDPLPMICICRQLRLSRPAWQYQSGKWGIHRYILNNEWRGKPLGTIKIQRAAHKRLMYWQIFPYQRFSVSVTWKVYSNVLRDYFIIVFTCVSVYILEVN